jgi:diguanylate cyclase (GGDEF)-like protein
VTGSLPSPSSTGPPASSRSDRGEPGRDSLTGLPDRAALRSVLRDVVAASSPGALLTLDLDRFRRVNDSLGRGLGDALLTTVAKILRDTVHEQAVVARTGGDEFAVCLPALDAPEQAVTVAETIHDRLDQPIQLDGHTVFTPASIGLVRGLPDYDDAEAVLRHADTAMYEAKEAPHRSVAVYEPNMTHRVDAQLSLDTELRQALNREEFVPFFQPIVALEDGRLHGFEVLARWHHPERGLLSPHAFLEAAEDTGLIVPIGHQVIRQACEVVSSLQTAPDSTAAPVLTANFSRPEFFRPETHAFLTDLFDAYEIAPRHFTMEISERTVAGISEEDVTAFCALKNLGVSILLDDFGTGFSSLQSLRRLPVDGLKIDKDLLAEAHGTAWDRDLVRLIVEMGHTLGQTVTAEGVETRPQLNALREMECTYGQGHLFARPVPASRLDTAFDDLVRTQLWSR